jgi:hypothetical protein
LTIKTYQSHAVLEDLKNGKVYRARKNLRFDVAYQGLITLFGLHCEAPIFGYLSRHKSCTNGKISSGVLLTLQVPADQVWLTEYRVWADYMYCVTHYTLPQNRFQLISNEEFTQRQFDSMLINLKEQRSPSQYRMPQTIMEKIRPEWLVSYEDYSLPPVRRFLQKILHR